MNSVLNVAMRKPFRLRQSSLCSMPGTEPEAECPRSARAAETAGHDHDREGDEAEDEQEGDKRRGIGEGQVGEGGTEDSDRPRLVSARPPGSSNDRYDGAP